MRPALRALIRWALLTVLFLSALPAAHQTAHAEGLTRAFGLPWLPGVTWEFHGGPHRSDPEHNTKYDALDFAPGNQDRTVVAAEEGNVLSAVVVDNPGDANDIGNLYIDHGSGWVTF